MAKDISINIHNCLLKSTGNIGLKIIATNKYNQGQNDLFVISKFLYELIEVNTKITILRKV